MSRTPCYTVGDGILLYVYIVFWMGKNGDDFSIMLNVGIGKVECEAAGAWEVILIFGGCSGRARQL